MLTHEIATTSRYVDCPRCTGGRDLPFHLCPTCRGLGIVVSDRCLSADEALVLGIIIGKKRLSLMTEVVLLEGGSA